MLRKKIKFYKTGLLLVLPVYLFFLNNSMQGYHSHIFANGIVITHSHYSKNCSENTNNPNQKSDKEQIIIFHGLLLISGDNIQSPHFCNFKQKLSTLIYLPPKKICLTNIPNTKKGRAPPVII